MPSEFALNAPIGAAWIEEAPAVWPALRGGSDDRTNGGGLESFLVESTELPGDGVVRARFEMLEGSMME